MQQEKSHTERIYKYCLLNRPNGIIKKMLLRFALDVFFYLVLPSIIACWLSYGHITANYNLIVFYTQLNYRYGNRFFFYIYVQPTLITMHVYYLHMVHVTCSFIEFNFKSEVYMHASVYVCKSRRREKNTINMQIHFVVGLHELHVC